MSHGVRVILTWLWSKGDTHMSHLVSKGDTHMGHRVRLILTWVME